MSLKEELLEQRAYYLYQIKNLELELIIDPNEEDKDVIKRELDFILIDLNTVNLELGKLEKI